MGVRWVGGGKQECKAPWPTGREGKASLLPLQGQPGPTPAQVSHTGCCAAELAFVWGVLQQPHKPPHTCYTNSLPEARGPQGLNRLKACLILSSWSLQPLVCALREGRVWRTRGNRWSGGMPYSPGRANGHCS